jgi:FkbM family methyltransferase
MVPTRYGDLRLDNTSEFSSTRSPGDRVVITLACALRSVVRLLRTPKEAVPVVEKVLRAALLIPVFAALSLPLRARTRLGYSVLLPGGTGFGDTLMCRLPDLIATYIWVFQEWEPDVTRFVTSRLDDGDVFIDVGANIGYYSLLAARSVGARGSVVAVEASPAMFDDLHRNALASDHGDRIRRVNKAAAAKSGTLTVFAGPRHNAGMSTTLPTRGLHVESTVEAMPLDEILTFQEITSTRLIKIDVEGAEPDVLAGMCNLIGSMRPDAEIVVELSPQWWPDRQLRPMDVLRPFIEAGFNVYKMNNSYSAWRYLWPNQVSDAIRLRGPLTRRASRLDLVLSRHDGDFLAIDARGSR